MANFFQRVLAWLRKADGAEASRQSPPKPGVAGEAAARQAATAPSAQHPVSTPDASLPPATIRAIAPRAEPEPSAPQAATPPPRAPTGDHAVASVPPRQPGLSTPQAGPVVDLHIGLDLGTSCSKIVIGDTYFDQYHGVGFGAAADGITQYLFPTRFFEGPFQATLTASAGTAVRSDLKLRLIDAVERGSDTIEAETDLGIYLALLLRHTFSWFDRHLATQHRTRRCCWWLNVGFPAKRIESNRPLADAYTRASAAAARAADAGEPVSRNLVRRFLAPEFGAPPAEARITDDRIHLYPEIAAQLAAYAYSPYRKDGPLLLLDIGAGTLDVSTLILHRREGEEVCSFHFCEVVPLGAFRLYQATHQAMSHISAAPLLPLVSAGDDPGWHPPDSARGFLSPQFAPTCALESAFGEARAAFARECLDTCQANFAKFKAYLDEPFMLQQRRPRVFRNGVNFVLSGGGSRLQFYGNLYPNLLEQRLRTLTSWQDDADVRRNHGQGLHRIHFTQPQNFRAAGIDAADFDRVSVAHGLAMGVETLMKITAKEASDGQ